MYSMKPSTCLSCGAQFEVNIISRVGLWLFLTGLFALPYLRPFLPAWVSQYWLFVVLGFLGAFFALAIGAAVTDTIKPWQFTLRDDRTVRRAVVNYGAVLSVLLYAVIFYSTKGTRG
jgi:hypothetical protein